MEQLKKFIDYQFEKIDKAKDFEVRYALFMQAFGAALYQVEALCSTIEEVNAVEDMWYDYSDRFWRVDREKGE